jgi:hypothetical protein
MTWTRRQKKSQKLFYSRLKNCALVVLIGPNCSLCAASRATALWTLDFRDVLESGALSLPEPQRRVLSRMAAIWGHRVKPGGRGGFGDSKFHPRRRYAEMLLNR